MKAWVIFGYDDPTNAPIYECRTEENGETVPTRRYITDIYGDGVVYEYDVDGERNLENGRLLKVT